MLMRSFVSIARLFLVLAAVWTPACSDERVEVAPSGAGVVTSTGPGAPGSGGDGAGGRGGGGEGGAAPGGGGAGDGGAGLGGGGDGGEVSWDTCETPAACLGDEPSVCPENACESNSLFAACDDGDPAPAYFACVSWAGVLREQVWAYLIDCFRQASHDELCTSSGDVIAACVASATDGVCESPDADITCAEADGGCPEGGFDLVSCQDDLRLFGSRGRSEYAACVSDEAADLPCEERHAHCHEQVLFF